ncbi:MAG: hypothetical protein AABW61_02140 [Candidatus Aenigmatarchaeota archaeon]
MSQDFTFGFENITFYVGRRAAGRHPFYRVQMDTHYPTGHVEHTGIVLMQINRFLFIH